MSFYTGRLTEITLKNGLLAGRLTCPAKAVPAAGQYLLGQRVDQTGDILPAVLFLGQKDEDGFWAAPPLPSAWQPGLELNLRGPFGRGFQLPAYARHVALAALASTPDRLLPLAVQALASGREVTLFCDLTESSLLLDLPAEVEVDALAAFPAALPWADVVCLDLPASTVPELRVRLGLQAGERISCPAQALILAPMPCAGLADCGVCAVPLRGSRGSSQTSFALACKDGPVFDLDVLEW